MNKIERGFLQNYIDSKKTLNFYKVTVVFCGIVLYNDVLEADTPKEITAGLKLFFESVCGLKFDTPILQHIITPL